jgi:hypothetical protein
MEAEMWIRQRLAVFTMVFMMATAGGVQSRAQQPPPEKKPVIETPSMRLAAGRNVFMVRTHGSHIPFEVIRSTMEGWGRFTFVETPEKADLIIEIASSGDSGGHGEREVRDEREGQGEQPGGSGRAFGVKVS